MNENETSDLSEDQPSQVTDLRSRIENNNLADGLDDEELEEISRQVLDGFNEDLATRAEWEANLEEWTNLALQVREEKSFPWRGASNVKYPLLSTAAMQFNARAYPSLIPSQGNLVKSEVIGKDADGQKLEKAKRISEFMSYQILNDMDCWEEDMDKLLIMLPIVGTLFKKTYYNSVKKKNVSELILPKNIVVDYWAKGLDTAERVSEIILMSKRRLKEKQMSKEYLDIDLGEPQQKEGKQDETTPYEIIEQHTFFDLDDDGYSEPYVVTFERYTGKVLRIVARYDDKGIYLNDEGDLAKIEPIQYYTKFSFIPNPDGGFYDIGFGLLLSPLNESVNTLINQLVDAGTLSNLQGGFLGKGLKIKMGESKWSPGEWKTVNTTADDLRKQIVPLPAKEPSAVLFQLMGTLVTGAKELASVAEIFTGKMPGQNTPATTTMATVEQGMKVFTAVYKRVYRSLKSEFKKLFELNNIYLDDQKYQVILDEPVSKEDFDLETYDICPGADPNTATQTEKLMKAQGVMEIMAAIPGILDPVEAVRRMLEAQEQPNIERLFNQQIQQTGQFQPPPDPKMAEMQMKSQLEQQKVAMQAQAQQQKMELERRDSQQKMHMQAQEHQMEMNQKMQMAQVDAATMLHKQRIFSAAEQQKQGQQMQMTEQNHQQSMRHQEEAAKSKLQQQKNSSKSGSGSQSQKPSSKTSKTGSKS